MAFLASHPASTNSQYTAHKLQETLTYKNIRETLTQKVLCTSLCACWVRCCSCHWGEADVIGFVQRQQFLWLFGRTKMREKCLDLELWVAHSPCCMQLYTLLTHVGYTSTLQTGGKKKKKQLLSDWKLFQLFSMKWSFEIEVIISETGTTCSMSCAGTLAPTAPLSSLKPGGWPSFTCLRPPGRKCWIVSGKPPEPGGFITYSNKSCNIWS